jgi:hypothetical protein
MSESNVPCSNRHVTYILQLHNTGIWNVRRWCAMFKLPCHSPAVVTKHKSIECQNVMCHVQTDMSLTSCDYKTKEHGMSASDVPCSNRHVPYPLWLQSKEHGMSESDVPCSNRHVTCLLWFQNKRAWNVTKWHAMFKQMCHLPPVITKQKEHGMSESDVPCSSRHVTYNLWLQKRRAWNVRQWHAMFK